MQRINLTIIALLLGLFPPCIVFAEDTTQTQPNVDVKVVKKRVQANSEMLLPDASFTLWTVDENEFRPDAEDRIVFPQRVIQNIERNDLDELVPIIRTRDGEPVIPEEFVSKVREVQQELEQHQKLRMHFIGYSDTQTLSEEEQEKYGNSVGLSKARAKAAAVHFRRALNLSRESVSYEGRGSAEPLTDNESEQGRALNRRVEVKVWYDDINEFTLDEEIVVPPPGVKRIRVCRQEPACVIVRKSAGSRKVQIRNVIEPLRFPSGAHEITPATVEQLRSALQRYAAKPNLVLRFTGHVDNTPIGARATRLYGDKLGLSKAQARLLARQAQLAMNLPDHQVVYEGAGDTQPIASNNNEPGRKLNRRVEVDVWYDAAPDGKVQVSDIQSCPSGEDGREYISKLYRPEGQDPIAPVQISNGKVIINDTYLKEMQSLVDRLQNERNLRINFVGYTDKALLHRRGAIAYGDNWGLAEVRSRNVMESIKQSLNLSQDMLSYEGKGFSEPLAIEQNAVRSLPNGVVVPEIWFDVLAPRDNDDVIEVINVTRDTEPVSPFALAPLRVTVDGKRLDDGLPHTADVQRCTDVQLDKTNIQLQFDNHKLDPRLNVMAWPPTISTMDNPETPQQENRTHFRGYTNYPGFVQKAEVRIFDNKQAIQDTPLYVIPLDKKLRGEWQSHEADAAELKYVMRVYDNKNRFDETAPARIWIVHQTEAVTQQMAKSPVSKLKRVYGENRLARQNIPLHGGTITVNGEKIPEGHRVWIMGMGTPIDSGRNFVAQQIIPKGIHTVEVAVLDEVGNGELFLRDLQLKSNDWFYVGIADLTFGKDDTEGEAKLVTMDDQHYNNDTFVDGHLAFYLKGKTLGDLELTASADTQEGPVEDLFDNFTDKNPRALFRRLDQDYYYPTYGDDSIEVEDAPTQGKFYLKLKKNESFGLWGNYKAQWHDSDLVQIDRGLYGAYFHYESLNSTSFGERRTRFDGFAAEPDSLRAREQFRGTGGSLYFLKHQDISLGSESLWVEVRDKDSGIILQSNRLMSGQDYDIDSIQGRVQLMAPLPSTADDSQLVQSGSLNGHPVYLIARYEYTPGFSELDDVATAVRASQWFGDVLKLGVTFSDEEQGDSTHTLGGVDVTIRKSAATYLKIESAKSEGEGTGELSSSDGGFAFDPIGQLSGSDIEADASRVETSVQLRDFFASSRGKLTLYHQQREAGYSAPGQLTDTDTTQYGGSFGKPIGESTDMSIKFDVKEQDLGLNTEAINAEIGHQINDKLHWTIGLRSDKREDNSLVVPDTQTVGKRTDVAFKYEYDSKKDWSAYYFVQATADSSETREDNNRGGAGGAYKINDRWKLNGEISGGDLGLGAKLGTDYLLTDNTNLYLTYGLDNERNTSGVNKQTGNLVSGFRTRYADGMSIYGEERYTHGDVPTGLTHAYGVDLTPEGNWRFGVSAEVGTLEDNETGAQTDRTALALSAGYNSKKTKYSSAFEYRIDETEISERTTYLLKNNLLYQTNPNWRLRAKLNLSQSDSTQGEFYDGEFVEAVLGYGFRPVAHDKLNTLFKYTYFYNLPAPDQVNADGDSADFIQRSHIVSVDTLYDIGKHWTLGAKYAYRLGELSADRVDPEFFQSRGQLAVLRADWHVIRNWDLLVEGKVREEIDAQDKRSGSLIGVYRHLGNHFKIGMGYNFTDFSDDLTDLDYDSRGGFINVIGKF